MHHYKTILLYNNEEEIASAGTWAYAFLLSALWEERHMVLLTTVGVHLIATLLPP